MTGIFMLTLFGLWLTFVIYISRKLSSFIPGKYLPKVIMVLLCLLILPLPVADEIIAKPQFDKLCREAVLKIDAEKIKGKTVRLVIAPSNQHISGTAIPMYYSHFSFRDFHTGEEYASHNRVTAEGGRFVQILNVSSSDQPMTVRKSSCPGAPSDLLLKEQYKFNLVDDTGKPAR